MKLRLPELKREDAYDRLRSRVMYNYHVVVPEVHGIITNISLGEEVKCEHDAVKMMTKNHGDVWICLKCNAVSNKDAFTEEELGVLVEYIKMIREKTKPKGK